MHTAITPLDVRFPDAALADLRERLVRARFAEPIPGSGWRNGIDLGYLKDLVATWRDAFDWRAWEARIGGFDNFTTVIDGVSLHFIHVRCGMPGALPLLLLHGWPGSFLEFLDIAEGLVAAGDGFDFVIPSLPGFGLSGIPRESGWCPARMARAMAVLMQRLGYERYGVHGGDIGAIVGGQLARLDAAHVCGYHTNLTLDGPPGEPKTPVDRLTAGEQADVRAMQAFWTDEAGYAGIQATKPDTIGAGLDDSPVALCAWIAEKFHAWVDRSGGGLGEIARDTLLANITLYWLTKTGTSSARVYRERRLSREAPFPSMAHPVTVPTGIARFPHEIARPPRSWIEGHYHIVRWTDFQSGGHFAALEQPALLGADIRAFFSGIR